MSRINIVLPIFLEIALKFKESNTTKVGQDTYKYFNLKKKTRKERSSPFFSSFIVWHLLVLNEFILIIILNKNDQRISYLQMLSFKIKWNQMKKKRERKLPSFYFLFFFIFFILNESNCRYLIKIWSCLILEILRKFLRISLIKIIKTNWYWDKKIDLWDETEMTIK